MKLGKDKIEFSFSPSKIKARKKTLAARSVSRQLRIGFGRDMMAKDDKQQKQIYKLTDLASELKKTLESTGLKKWSITLEGYLEASSGFLPGGKAGFKASLTLSND